MKQTLKSEQFVTDTEIQGESGVWCELLCSSLTQEPLNAAAKM